MKTTKAKTTSTAKKISSTSKSVKGKSLAAAMPEPSEDDIRMKAQEIYNQRMQNGDHATAADDWHLAEKILRGL